MRWKCGTSRSETEKVHHPAATSPRCAGGGRHRGKMAPHGRCDCRFCLCAVARRRGALCPSSYTPSALRIWAKKISAWSRGGSPRGARLTVPASRHRGGRDIFVYFDNDVKTRAPYDAMTLAHQLGLGPKPGRPPAPGNVAETPRVRWPGFAAQIRAHWQSRCESSRTNAVGIFSRYPPKRILSKIAHETSFTCRFLGQQEASSAFAERETVSRAPSANAGPVALK